MSLRKREMNGVGTGREESGFIDTEQDGDQERAG